MDNLTEIVKEYAFGAAILFLWVSLVFYFARRMKRYDFIDVAWATFFMLLSLTWFMREMISPWWSFVFVGFVLLWGIRLTHHLYYRFRSRESEDSRYVALRTSWHSQTGLNIYLRIYIIQILLVLVVALPIILFLKFSPKESLNILQLLIFFLGLLLGLTGLIIETIADHQLKRFLEKSNNSRVILNIGLWEHARHPNYFGELLVWWGIGIISLVAVPWGLGLLGPILLTYLICYVSGVPPKEKRLQKKVGWSQYEKETRLFLPIRKNI